MPYLIGVHTSLSEVNYGLKLYSNTTKPMNLTGFSPTTDQPNRSYYDSMSAQQKVRSRGLEEVVILNVDTNTLETPFDDLKRIPSDVVINSLFVGSCVVV